jgi:hypothetical protein
MAVLVLVDGWIGSLRRVDKTVDCFLDLMKLLSSVLRVPTFYIHPSLFTPPNRYLWLSPTYALRFVKFFALLSV